MSQYIPFQGTKVSERQSMMNVMVMLEETGFEQTAQASNKGNHVVMAFYKSVEFRFEIQMNAIVTAIIKNSSNRKQRDIRFRNRQGIAALQDIQEQSLRVGWRLMALHVKTLCDSIKLGVITPTQAFAGNLVVAVKAGKTITLAEHLTVAIENDALCSPEFRGLLALEDNTR